LKYFSLLFVVCLLVACESQRISIVNDCPGAWVRIMDGENHVIRDALMPSERISVPLTGNPEYSTQFLLAADGFRISDGKPLGSQSRTFSVGGNGGPTGVRQEEWRIDWLPQGCPDRDF